MSEIQWRRPPRVWRRYDFSWGCSLIVASSREVLGYGRTATYALGVRIAREHLDDMLQADGPGAVKDFERRVRSKLLEIVSGPHRLKWLKEECMSAHIIDYRDALFTDVYHLHLSNEPEENKCQN